MATGFLSSWREGPAKQAIIEFVERTCGEDGSPAVPVEERVAVFDNDGTLWCEKPMPIQLDFILRRLAEMVAADPELRRASAVEGRRRARRRLVRCAHGRALRRGRHQRADVGGRHPRRLRRDQRRGLRGAVRRLHAQRRSTRPSVAATCECAYAPMVELLGYLEANGFSNYIAPAAAATSCGRSARTCTASRGSGSSAAAAPSPTPATTHGGTITHKPEVDYLDDGPEKPVRIWNRTGRRPLLAAGNSNGDVADARVHPPRRQADAAAPRPPRRRRARVRLHERRRAGARNEPRLDGWTVVSIKDDWTTVF